MWRLAGGDYEAYGAFGYLYLGQLWNFFYEVLWFDDRGRALKWRRKIATAYLPT